MTKIIDSDIGKIKETFIDIIIAITLAYIAYYTGEQNKTFCQLHTF